MATTRYVTYAGFRDKLQQIKIPLEIIIKLWNELLDLSRASPEFCELKIPILKLKHMAEDIQELDKRKKV